VAVYSVENYIHVMLASSTCSHSSGSAGAVMPVCCLRIFNEALPIRCALTNSEMQWLNAQLRANARDDDARLQARV
jgi:hypothetical protein